MQSADPTQTNKAEAGRRRTFISSARTPLVVTFTGMIILAGRLGAEPPARLDITRLPSQAKLVEDVVVPIPSEIFTSLDKFAKPEWRKVLRPSLASSSPGGTQAQIALLLGVVVAEGFIAVEAEDSVEVKSVGRSVLSLAKAINVEKSILKRSNSIIEHAETRQWEAVRTELDGVLSDVKEAMIELNSEQLSQLVSLGGWLRGTEALSYVVGEEYTAEAADLLRQPILLDYFDDRLDRMDTKFRSNKIVIKMHEGVLAIGPLVRLNAEEDVSAAKVAAIGAITSELVRLIARVQK